MTRREAAARRDRLARQERAWCAALSAAMLAGVVLCAYAAMRLMPYYGEWKRGNSLGSHPIGTLSAPFSLDIEIRYDAERPRNVRIKNLDTGRQIYGLEEVAREDPEPGVLVLHGDFSADAGDGEYALELVPGANTELSCQISSGPSMKYISARFVPYADKAGDLWLELYACYGNEARTGPVDVSVRLSGAGYSSEIYSFRSDLPEIAKRVNVSRLIVELGADAVKGTSVEMSASAGYAPPDGSGGAYANEKRALALDDWPAYDPDGDFSFDGADTNAYLAAEDEEVTGNG